MPEPFRKKRVTGKEEDTRKSNRSSVTKSDRSGEEKEVGA
jgi:hypothetical protein